MTFELLDIDSPADFYDAIGCQWLAYENPSQSFFRMFCPLRGEGDLARAESMRESAARQWEWHVSDPTSCWRKVVDNDGKIVGACLWKIYPENPFHTPDEHSEVYWYPEGEAREYVTQCLEQMDAPRRQMAAKPQVYLNILFTHPDYRRQGVADIMMTWGKQKADEMGVEMWLDATEYGVPVYQKHGFTIVRENHLRPTKENPGEDWKKTEKLLQPMTFWTMRRPIRGVH